MALMQRAAEVPQCRASLHQIETLRLDVHEGLGEQSHRPVELGPGLRRAHNDAGWARLHHS